MKVADEYTIAAAHLVRALRSENGEGFHAFKAYIAYTLDDDQKGAIAWAALMACPTSVIEAVIEHLARPAMLDVEIMSHSAIEYRDSARRWAAYATQGEIRAFVGEGIRAMTPKNRDALIEFLTRKDAA